MRPSSNARHLRDTIRRLCTVDAYQTSLSAPTSYGPQILGRSRSKERRAIGARDGSATRDRGGTRGGAGGLVKRIRPSRVTDLYNSLVYENEGQGIGEKWRRVVVMNKDGGSVDEGVNERIRTSLEDCRQLGHAEGAMEILDDMRKEGYVATVRAIIMAIESCLPAEEFELAEEALRRLEDVPRDSVGWNKRLKGSARSLVAIAYTTKGRYEDGLRVMGLGGYRELEWGQKGEIRRVLEGLDLGKDSVGWGVLVKGLSKVGMAEAALEVVNVGMGMGLEMTDGLLHVTLDALRLAGKGRQAEWLFDKAVLKGIVPSERTVASMLMALALGRSVKEVQVGRIEALVDMVTEPSARFLSTVLNVFAYLGMLRKAEETFKRIEVLEGVGEGEYMRMMKAYGNYVRMGWEFENDGKEMTGMYEEVNDRVNRCWEGYMEKFGKFAAMNRDGKEMRVKILSSHLRAKLHCFRIEDCVNLLGDIATGRYEWFEMRRSHVATVLGGIELSCDVKQMKRVLGMMAEMGMRHDVRTVAFCVGTFVRDGDLNSALEILRAEGEKAVKAAEKDEKFQPYHLMLLKKRLDTLEMGFKDSGIKEVKDLRGISRRIESKWKALTELAAVS
eukprot:GFKZ01000555.1.p1 GENE.GFKZ01000555.1~~GFKZ01000555.1.p1  ORF type:complete len:679 (-),score=128.84 GFKZ01000555.1:442-2286(-)